MVKNRDYVPVNSGDGDEEEGGYRDLEISHQPHDSDSTSKLHEDRQVLGVSLTVVTTSLREMNGFQWFRICCWVPVTNSFYGTHTLSFFYRVS